MRIASSDRTTRGCSAPRTEGIPGTESKGPPIRLRISRCSEPSDRRPVQRATGKRRVPGTRGWPADCFQVAKRRRFQGGDPPGPTGSTRLGGGSARRHGYRPPRPRRHLLRHNFGRGLCIERQWRFLDRPALPATPNLQPFHIRPGGLSGGCPNRTPAGHDSRGRRSP